MLRSEKAESLPQKPADEGVRCSTNIYFPACALLLLPSN
jgi:hypothetical protein